MSLTMDKILHTDTSGHRRDETPPNHNCYAEKDGFIHLQAHVATSGFDSNQKFDAPACHPNTRLAVLDEIMSWVVGVIARIQWILWLNGAAGAGKSAIARSIVERCVAQNIPIARFFFYRSDSTRNNVKPVVATLAHQLMEVIPELKYTIIPKISADPLIFTKSLETQFDRLIFDPLRELRRQVTKCPTVLLLFDGVDECRDKDDQVALIRILTRFIETLDFPLIVFFGSRTEGQLTMEFNDRQLSELLLRLPLDNNYHADDDIRTFLNVSFLKIRETHPLAIGLGTNWPSRKQIDKIIKKSSGQFIYASVVVNFLFFPFSTPSTRLEIVLGLKPAGRLTPFAQLDELYRYILSQVQDIDCTLSVLALLILNPDINSLRLVTQFLNIRKDEVRGTLANLTSVITINGNSVKFLHASLPDFLTDPLRSGEYCLTTPRWPTFLSIMYYSHGYKFRNLSTLNPYLLRAEPSKELYATILSFNPQDSVRTGMGIGDYLNILHAMDFGDGKGGSVYAQQLNLWTRYSRIHDNGDILEEIQREHNISAILRAIKQEKKKQARALNKAAPILGEGSSGRRNPRSRRGSHDREMHEQPAKKQKRTTATTCEAPVVQTRSQSNRQGKGRQ